MTEGNGSKGSNAGRRRGGLNPFAAIADLVVPNVVGAVDVDEVVGRIDVEALLERIDVARVLQRADLQGIVAESTRGITGGIIDLVRRQLVGIDLVATRVAARLVRRDPSQDPSSPPTLRDDGAAPHPRRGPSVSGRYAGPVSRAAAMAVDLTTMLFLFGLATAISTWTLDRLFGTELSGGSLAGWLSFLLVTAWAFCYFAIPLAMTGRTFGKGVVGLKVVRRDGTPVLAAQAALRTVVLPFSWMLLGLGLVGGVFGRERRTLHDLVAGTTEVIDWGDRTAALPTPLARWIEQHQFTSG